MIKVNRLTKFAYTIPNVYSQGRYEQRKYSESNGNLDTMRTASGDTLTYTYSPVNLLDTRETSAYKIRYGYKDGATSNNYTSLVLWKQYTIGSQSSTGFTYEYDAVGQVVGGAAISMVSNATNQVISNKGFQNFNVKSMLVDGAIGAGAGRLGGAGAGGNYVLKDAAKLMNKNAIRAVKNGIKNGFTSAIKQYSKRMVVKQFYKGLVKGIPRSFGIGFAQNTISRVSKRFV